MRPFFKLLFFVLSPFCADCIEPGFKYKPTKGEVWPAPQHQVKQETYYVLKHATFNITKPYHSCDILDEGIKRLIYKTFALRQSFIVSDEKENNPDLQYSSNNSKTCFPYERIEFRIELTEKCENYPHLDMDEKYQLSVGKTIKLSSASIWGILRGLVTFNQLIYYSDDHTELRINATSIEDYPAYLHRGLLIDTGRHYLPLEIICLMIDAMEINKMNVLHWHIVDDQSFPYQSKRFPNLSKYGAFHSSMVYTKEDIQQVIERGRLAGIRVIPEFDVPGHVRSWGQAYPKYLTKCYKGKQMIGLGPLNPIVKNTYMFLKRLYREITHVFPDKYIHLGGDEVDKNCWKSNPIIQNFLKKHNITNINMLHTLFMSKVPTLLPPKTKYMLWQDVFDSGVPLPSNTILQVWNYRWVNEMDMILKAGHRVVFSATWYLNYALNEDWDTYYRDDPRNMVYVKRLNATGLQDIIGGEACIWGEKVDQTNILARVWPRASAVAERLWTGMNYTILPINPVTDFARRRIEEHVCRMRQHGIPAQPPNGPSFCIGVDTKFQSHNRRQANQLRRKINRT